MHRQLPIFLVLAIAFTTGAAAVVTPQRSDLSEFNDPILAIANSYQPATALGKNSDLRASELAALGIDPTGAYLDLRSNRWATLMPSRALLPGNGTGNSLSWDAFGGRPADNAAIKQLAWDALVRYIDQNGSALRIDTSELPPSGHVTVHENGRLIQIYAPRVHQGLRVRDSSITAVINNGNLVLFGAIKWGDIETAVAPTLSAAQALQVLSSEVAQPVVFARKAAYLELVPVAAGAELGSVVPGQGYDHRLVWVLSPNIQGDGGRWEGLVDAASGDLLAFRDLNQYGSATRRTVKGGVYPVSNDGVPPDGVEQANWPMPWADLDVGGETVFTDGGGNLGFCTDGTITTALAGQFMLMNDQCGAISESSTGNLNLGTSGGIDCTVPAGGSLGNTHASRSGFFEMNQVKALGRGQLPDNMWLQGQLTATMNIPQNCNANWNGTGVNFYTSGGGCSNTGELAGVFDHEWGHGMDNNDAVPSISNPGEGIADIYAAVRLNDSCMGRNFLGGNCGGYGDPCTQCSGVRDIDWANRASGLPHTITGVGGTVGIDALCGSGATTPCGGSTHCEGAVYAEAAWDLFNRDLPTAGFDHNSSLQIATGLVFQGGGNANNWFTCTATFGGCNADGGYLNFLAADDDNGDLSDGTPHMASIFAAFDRHEIACGTPTVQEAGCVGVPTSGPTTFVAGIDKGAQVDITPQAGVDFYDVYRTDGVFGCDQGKIKVGSIDNIPAGISNTSGLIFVDEGLQNGREYFYTVVGRTDEGCITPASTCTSTTPSNGPNLTLAAGDATLTINTGDGDEFIDNCEEATIAFDVSHIGTTTQHNVRIVSIEPLSHPSSIITTTLPNTVASTLVACGTASATFNVQPRDMAPNDTLQFRVGVTSDELGVVKTGVVSFDFAESDFSAPADVTFEFNADAESWEVIQGTFMLTTAAGPDMFWQSSSFLDGQCDQITSPAMKLASNSTMSLDNNFDIEPIFNNSIWYDRANIGIFDPASGERTPVDPDGGRLYNATGANGNCGTEGQDGWADSMPTWASSSWSSTALQSSTFADETVQLHVYYGTDPAANGSGFRFDTVSVTNIRLQDTDGQSDVCSPPSFLFGDGFESGNTSAWSSTAN